MSRAYRIKVRESQNRTVKARDHVSTQLEILSILPPEQMADLLAKALEEQGFERCGDQLSREQNGVVIVVDATTGIVSVHSEDERAVTVEGELDGYAPTPDGAVQSRRASSCRRTCSASSTRRPGATRTSCRLRSPTGSNSSSPVCARS